MVKSFRQIFSDSHIVKFGNRLRFSDNDVELYNFIHGGNQNFPNKTR